MKDTKLIQLVLGKSDIEILKKMADKDFLPLSTYIRQIVKKFIQEKNEK